MHAITEAVHAEIDERRARHQGHPDRELLEHLLVAVQRERVAAVGYDLQRLGERLTRAPLPDEARRAIQRAITQIWIDENLHARYVLGVLLRQRGLKVYLGAQAEHAEGGVGGWMSAVEQHTTWGEAPVERLTAAVLDAGGKLSGRIPPEVRASLAYGPLHRWCSFSADAEQSAVISFQHMVTLADAVASLAESEIALPAGFTRELTRMSHDEEAHKQVFDAIAEHLGDDDGLLPGKSAEGLIAAIASVKNWLAGPPLDGAPSPPTADTPVCRGGPVVVARGARPDDKLATFDQALDRSGFFDLLAARSAALGVPGAELAIVIKVDLMLAYHRDDPSSYVDPALIEHLVDALRRRGYRSITVCDAQNIYDRYYKNRSIASVGAYVGLRPEGRYRLVDLADEQEPHSFAHAMGVYSIGRSWRDAHVRVTFAKLKTHPIAIGQLTLRTTATVIPQTGEFFFSERLADFSALAAAVIHDFPPHFGLIDGYSHAADGLLGVLADPTPKHPHLFLAGPDVASVDHVAFRLMGERDPSRSPDLRALIRLLGDPQPHIRPQGDLTPIADWDRADAGLLAAPLSALASPVYASLSRQGALFTAALDPEAFPPIGETLALAAARKALRAMLGFDHR